uniref:Uncharacterized protein n=1 Tax=Anguilla anguilla TaxID=7936 RepID=A0A0E9U6X7_ANGAN
MGCCYVLFIVFDLSSAHQWPSGLIIMPESVFCL